MGESVKAVNHAKQAFNDIFTVWLASSNLTEGDLINQISLICKEPEYAVEFLMNIYNEIYNRKNSEAFSSNTIIDLRRVETSERNDSGKISSYVDGWNCVFKEVSISLFLEDSIVEIENEIKYIENLPRHPNLVRYLFHDRKGEKFRIFFSSYASNLHDYITNSENKNKLVREFSDGVKILTICTDIASALLFLHQHDIVHRDLKAQSIYMTADYNVLVGDFDISKKFLQKTRTTANAIRWMAPEVILQNDSVNAEFDFSVDIWCCGLIIYELLTLTPPYEEVGNMELTTVIKDGKRPRIGNNLPNTKYHKRLRKLFEKCTILDQEERPTIREVKRFLSQKK